jgi:hypothetical protein
MPPPDHRVYADCATRRTLRIRRPMQNSGFSAWLLEAPLWLIAIVMLASMAAAAFFGWYFRKRPPADSGQKAGEDDGSEEGYTVSAVLGLLALLTGFTFAIALDRYDTRRERVLIEANAIGTTYLRAQLLEEPHRTRLSNLLIEYTDNRLALALDEGERRQELLRRNDALITDLWTATVAAFPTIRSYDFSSSFLETMNLLIDMDTARKVARRSHVPPEIFLVLLFYQIVTAGVLGSVLIGRRKRAIGLLLFVLFGSSTLLIIDIDTPTRGLIRESQDAMNLLRQSLAAQPPAVFDRLSAPPAAEQANTTAP